MDHIKDFDLGHFINVQESLWKTYWLEKKWNTDGLIQFKKQIIRSVEYLIKYSENVDENKNMELYTSFLKSIENNLISTLKNENKDIVLEPFYRTSKKIATLAQFILNIDKDSDKELLSIKQHLLINTLAYFDFISDWDKIAFSKFETNHELFQKQKNAIMNKLKNINEINIETINNLIINNIKQSSTSNSSNFDIETISISDFINHQENKENDPILFEVHSYTLLQKIKHFIEISDNNLIEINSAIISYIENTLEKITMLYNGELWLNDFYYEIQKLDDHLLNKKTEK